MNAELINRKFRYSEVEIDSDIIMSLDEVIINNKGKVTNITNGKCKVGDISFSFECYTNINGQGDKRTEQLMYKGSFPSSVNACELIDTIIAFIENDIK